MSLLHNQVIWGLIPAHLRRIIGLPAWGRSRWMGNAMSNHKFKVGQTVNYTPRFIGTVSANAIFKITRLLPAEDDELQYRIRSAPPSLTSAWLRKVNSIVLPRPAPILTFRVFQKEMRPLANANGGGCLNADLWLAVSLVGRASLCGAASNFPFATERTFRD